MELRRRIEENKLIVAIGSAIVVLLLALAIYLLWRQQEIAAAGERVVKIVELCIVDENGQLVEIRSEVTRRRTQTQVNWAAYWPKYNRGHNVAQTLKFPEVRLTDIRDKACFYKDELDRRLKAATNDDDLFRLSRDAADALSIIEGVFKEQSDVYENARNALNAAVNAEDRVSLADAQVRASEGSNAWMCVLRCDVGSARRELDQAITKLSTAWQAIADGQWVLAKTSADDAYNRADSAYYDASTPTPEPTDTPTPEPTVPPPTATPS